MAYILGFIFADGSIHGKTLACPKKLFEKVEARKIYKKSHRLRIWREIKQKFGIKFEELLYDMLVNKELSGAEIAKIIGVHSSTIYRWLNKTKIRMPAKRGSEEWKKRVLWGRSPTRLKRVQNVIYPRLESTLFQEKVMGMQR